MPANRVPRTVLITGGAGFVGGQLAVGLAVRHPDWEIVALDNLRRRGSELNLPRLRAHGVCFIHGDVREAADLAPLAALDAIIECSAEPSALTGFDGAVDYIVRSNLLGAWHCLELARRHDAQLVFLSTSRVYPIAALSALAYREAETRLALLDDQPSAGASAAGVSEDFSLEGSRTLYGATKLSGELLIAEYRDAFGLRAVIDRCGVIAGPWQMGKVDQGVFALWVLAHYFNRELAYIGHGGTGKQVRDLIHVADLVDLIDEQLHRPEHWDGITANVSGGATGSLSLRETTEICRDLTGHAPAIASMAETRPGDVPIYIGDCTRLFSHTDWRPRRSPRETMEDIFAWVSEHENALAAALD